jgi:hypothetical protein
MQSLNNVPIFFAKRPVFRSENHESFGYDVITEVPLHGRHWYVREPSLLNVTSGKYRSKAAALHQQCYRTFNMSERFSTIK